MILVLFTGADKDQNRGILYSLLNPHSCAHSNFLNVRIGGRDTAREVARHMSAMANSCDNDGILTGNWIGDYEGGAKPCEWSGRVPIFQKYLATGESVNYGQCWVFSGLVTSMM